MRVIDEIIDKVKLSRKTIVLPEFNDERVLDAANIIVKNGIADIIILGENQDKLDSRIKFINPKDDDLTQILVDKFYELRKNKGMTLEESYRILTNDYMYYACMLVKIGYADGVVSGSRHSTSEILKPALEIIKTKKDIDFVSSFFLMEIPNKKNYDTYIFADCGLEKNITIEKLALIAGLSGKSYEQLLNKKAKIALLSYSTKGSALNPEVDKVIQATTLAKIKFPQYKIDGELQLDAAINEAVAKVKAPNSEVAGKANVLVFPNLDAGNIGYKLVQYFSNACAYGPITQGMKHPINDLSRGCSVEDIVGVVAITCLQAIRGDNYE